MNLPPKGKLGKRQYYFLVEALRRYTRFHNGKNITTVYLGLGCMTTYKSLYNADLMVYSFMPHRRCMTWWRLTEKGASIVQTWLDAGYTYKDIERGNSMLYMYETAPS